MMMMLVLGWFPGWMVEDVDDDDDDPND